MKFIPIGIQRALRHQDYFQFLKGQTVFVLGFWLRGTALSWLIYSMTASSFYLGLVASAGLLPALLLGPISGILTDKIPKKKILLFTQVLNVSTTSTMFLLIFLNYVAIWHIIIAALIFGASQGIGVPARNAFILDMVGRKDLPNAVPLNAAVFNLGSLVGPALAGVLIPLIGEGGIFAMNIFGESFAFYTVTKIKAQGLPDPPVEGQKNSFMDGFKYAYDSKIIFYSLLLLCIASIIISPVQVLLPIIATEVLGGDSRLFGLLGAMIGIGGLIGSILLASRTKRDGIIYWLMSGNIILIVSFYIFAFTKTIFLSICILFVIGFGTLLQHISMNTLVQFNAPHQYVGRIMALHSMCLRGMGMLGSLFAGISGEYLGIQNSFLLSASILLICSIYILPRLYKAAK